MKIVLDKPTKVSKVNLNPYFNKEKIMKKFISLHIKDLRVNLHAQAKAAAAMAKISLKTWVIQAIREKLDKKEK